MKAWLYPLVCVVAPALWALALRSVLLALEHRRARHGRIDYSI